MGTPHYACIEAGIPIIAVRENKPYVEKKFPMSFIMAGNYLEAAGMIMAMKAGIDYKSVRRPLEYTSIIHEGKSYGKD